MTHPLLTWPLVQLDAIEAVEASKRRYTTDYWGRPCPSCDRRVQGHSIASRDQRLEPCGCHLGDVAWVDFLGVAPSPDAAALATVAAFRSLLALHSPATHQAIRYGRPHGEPHEYCVTCIGGSPCECCPVNHPDNQWPCPTVRALGSAFAHHDGYDPTWAPTEGEQ